MQRYKKQELKIEQLYNDFPVNFIQLFELDNNGRVTNRKLKIPSYKFLVKNDKKEKIDYENMITKNLTYQEKQVYIMRISNYTQNPMEIEKIFREWDWFEFIFYANSINTQQALNN